MLMANVKALRRLAAALTTALAIIATPAMGQSAPDAERAELVRNLVELGAAREVSREEIRQFLAMLFVLAGAGSAGMPELDGERRETSLDAVSRAVAGQVRSWRIEGMTMQMTVAELRAAIDFFRSPAGRAALRARVEYEARLRAARRGAANVVGQHAAHWPEYRPSAEERSFTASPPGRALISATNWLPRAVALFEADYCGLAACNTDDLAFFRRAHALAARER